MFGLDPTNAFQLQSLFQFHSDNRVTSSLYLSRVPKGNDPMFQHISQQYSTSPHKNIPTSATNSLFKSFEWGHKKSLIIRKDRVSTNEESDNESFEKYNDDAFGLVFLTSLFISKDYCFCTIFTVLSFIAVIGTNQLQIWKADDKWLPGVMALASLILTIMFDVLDLYPIGDINRVHWNGIENGLISSQKYEIAVCAISFTYGLFQSVSTKNQ